MNELDQNYLIFCHVCILFGVLMLLDFYYVKMMSLLFESILKTFAISSPVCVLFVMLGSFDPSEVPDASREMI